VIKWIKSYGYAGTQSHDLAENDEGGVVIIGSGCIGHNFIIYTDSLGNVKWSKSYPMVTVTGGQDILRLSSTEYLISGMATNWTMNAGFLMSVSKTGVCNWYKHYDISSQVNCWFKKTIPLHTGGFASLMRVSYNGKTGCAIIRTGSTGAPLWHKTFFFPSTIETEDIIALDKEGAFMVAGMITYSGIASTQGLLIKADSSGNFLWAKTTGKGFNQGQGADRMTNLLASEKDTYYATGFAEGGNLWLLKDSLGLCNSMSDQTVTSNSNLILSNGLPVPVNVSFSVTSLSYTVGGGYHVKSIVCSENLPLLVGIKGEKRANDSFSFFPNPAVNKIVLHYLGSETTETIKIIDMSGRNVQNHVLTNAADHELRLDLSPGVYQIVLSRGQKNITKRLVIIGE
jgi:hypothetical protein